MDEAALTPHSVLVSQALGFLLVLFRTAALSMTMPLLGAMPVPMRVRLGVSVGLAAAVFVGAGSPHFDEFATIESDGHAGLLLGALARETALGLVFGLTSKMLLEAARTAGSVAGLGMGMGFGNLIDPLSGQSGAPLAGWFSWAGMAWALELGVHTDAVVFLAASVHRVGPGADVDLAVLAGYAVEQMVAAILLSIRLGAPVLSTVILGHVVVGISGRITPQLNVQSLGFSLAIAAGFWGVFAATSDIGLLAAEAAALPFSPDS